MKRKSAGLKPDGRLWIDPLTLKGPYNGFFSCILNNLIYNIAIV